MEGHRYGTTILALMVMAIVYALPAWAQAKGPALRVAIDPTDGSYKIDAANMAADVLHSGVAVELDTGWVRSSDYPRHTAHSTAGTGELGVATVWTVTFSGLPDRPGISYQLLCYRDRPFAELQVFVHNGTGRPVHVRAIRPIAAVGPSVLSLGGSDTDDRVLSDSFSEDRPNITIHDLGDSSGPLYRGVGSQLIYNRKAQESFFAGALTSDRFLTILRLHTTGTGQQAHMAAYEVDSTGTTEMEKENSLQEAPAEDQMPLEVAVAPGEDLPSEKLLLGMGTDPHEQLETYGALIRKLHHARVTAPAPMGWWSWTAYYFGLNEGTALTNAQWETQHLRPLGYDFFHIDEGYQYARGEYATPDASLFPHGLARLERQVTALGLVPGIWTAPFEVSERSWVYQKHPDWLVHNAHGAPVPIGWVTGHQDRLYVLDCTNPGAQAYLEATYTTMAHTWGVRYFKLDFMDDSAIEGQYYRPNTTAMQAQRTGLEIIRKSVGDGVLLDKDGSVMLDPVGLVDFGRISQDTGHTFDASRDAATGIAARYYMNRNFFVSDPDAFTVSRQTVDDQSWHGGKRPLTLDEAKVSIALAAVAGGMYEIGDDLPTLGADPLRLALVQNTDLIHMVRLGRASVPVDLMDYSPEDGRPSIFFLREGPRQSMLTIFNWTDRPRTHTLTLAHLGLASASPYHLREVFLGTQTSVLARSPFTVSQPAHSVRIFQIIDTAIAAQAPDVHVQHPSTAKAGESVVFFAHAANTAPPAVQYQWDFGDGVVEQGARTAHAFTHAGNYTVTLTATGLDGLEAKKKFSFPVTGSIATTFAPAKSTRYPIVP